MCEYHDFFYTQIRIHNSWSGSGSGQMIQIQLLYSFHWAINIWNIVIMKKACAEILIKMIMYIYMNQFVVVGRIHPDPLNETMKRIRYGSG